MPGMSCLDPTRPGTDILDELEDLMLGDQPARRQTRESGALRGHVRLVVPHRTQTPPAA